MYLKYRVAETFEDQKMHLHSLKAYSNSSSVLGKMKGGSSFFISSSKSILDNKSVENEKEEANRLNWIPAQD